MESNLRNNKANILKAGLLLLCGLIITAIAMIYTAKNNEQQAIHRFNLICNDLKARIEARLFAHEQLLLSGASFFIASDTVTREDWRRFYEKPDTPNKLPGLQGVGFSIIIPKNQLHQHLRKIRSEGFPNYAVFPPGDRDLYTSIIYLEPFTGRNLKAFGFDMYSEFNRRKAMETARDSNIAVLTEKVILVQEDSFNIQAGTLMYVPVYKKNMPHTTVDQRQKAIVGWVYSPYRMNDLMEGILGAWNELIQDRIRLQIYDSQNINPNSLLYDSQENEPLNYKKQRINTLTVQFNSNTWTLVFNQNAELFFYMRSKALIVLVCGISISFLFFSLALNLLNTRNKAQKIAIKLTADLQKSESRFRNMIANNQSIMLLIDPVNGDIIEANQAASVFYGYTLNHLCSLKIFDINISPISLIEEELKSTQNGISDHYYFTHKLATGDCREVEAYTSPIDLDDKKFLFVIIHDITERNLAEQQLKQTRLNYESFFNTINDLLFVLDFEGKIIHINQKVTDRLNFQPEELVGQSVLILHPGEQRDEAAIILKNMIEGKASYCPIPIISKTNQIIPVETRISKGVWNDRPVIFGVSKDISELKISEEKFSSAFLYSANIMAISLFETGEYIEVNQAFLDLFGLKREQVIGHNAIELGIFPVELRERLIQEFSKNNKLMNYEVTLEVKDKKVTGLFSANLIQIQNKKCWLTSMQNITDRKITEEALKQSKQELETIFSASPDGIAMTDINGNLVIASDKLAKMYGFDVDEMQTLIGRSIFDFIHPSDHHILKQNFNKLITNQIDEKVTQYLAVKKDKSTFYIEVNYSLINNHQGDPCNILFIGRDITQRKQIDEILQRWARIFEYSGWGIVIVSPDGKTMEMMNPAFAKMHGYNETELVNQNLSVVFSSDSFTKICTFTGNDQTQIHQSWEAVNIKKSNEYFPVLIDTTRVNDQLGIIQYYVINVMDISERKLSEVALRESETRLRLAIEGSKAGTWDWNIQTGEVIYGQYWAEMIGYSIEEIEPNIDSWEKLICPEDLINVKTALKNHFDGHTPFYEAEHRMKTKTGEWKWILDKGMVVSRDENGSPLRAIGTHVDIDASKKAQIKLLEYNKQLKELDATKDKLFSIIAHDLKNPISGVLAISGLLVENFKKYEIQKNEKFLDQIHNASKNALNLLENLLYWARSQTGKMAFNPEKYLLSPLINESIEVTKSAARIKFIHIDTLIDEKLVVNVDQNLMQTVLRNLVTNAIKFTNPGGNITIEAKNIDNKVQISVTDNGVGMTKSQLEKLFSKEITEITAGTANEKGSGLGLLICKEFVEMHNGTISVESEPGKGSRFNILLP